MLCAYTEFIDLHKQHKPYVLTYNTSVEDMYDLEIMSLAAQRSQIQLESAAGENFEKWAKNRRFSTMFQGFQV